MPMKTKMATIASGRTTISRVGVLCSLELGGKKGDIEERFMVKV